ncbi:MAG: hemolysin family protein [Gemmatimonadota bacterium]
MIWLVFWVGLILALFGAMAGAALVTASREELARSATRRLRGAPGSLTWIAEVERDLAVASATTALGVIVLGAVAPAYLAGARLLDLALFVVLIAAPLAVFSGYLVPRWLTRPYAARVRNALSPILRPWGRLLGLLLPARPSRPQAELQAFWRDAAAGAATDEELIMVGGVMTFSARTAREVMTPRTEIVASPENASIEEIRLVFAQSGYSRIPVYRGTLDEIIGMLHAFDLFRLREGDPLPIRPVALAPASRSCGDLLLDMQRERRHLAVVLDEFGGTLGILTFEDLLEELVGEIFDEHDEGVVPAQVAATGILEADGSTSLAAIEERFGVKLPGTSTTIGGLLLELAGRIPVAGERFLIGELELDVLQATPARVDRLLIRPGPVLRTTLVPSLLSLSPG